MVHHSSGRTLTAGDVQTLLASALPGADITVRDDTHKHLGHNAMVGHHGGHYHIRIVWQGFTGQARLARHRQVMALLHAAWHQREVHAVTLRLVTPNETEI
jgi:BolA protein